MSWFTSDSTQASAWREVGAAAPLDTNVWLILLQLSGNTIRVVVTSAYLTNAAVYHVCVNAETAIASDRRLCACRLRRLGTNMFARRGFPRAGIKPSFSCQLRLTGVLF